MAAPAVRSGRARLYRTAIRDGASEGINFAGHYTIVRIGCGAATICPAILDRMTGRVYFPPQLSSAGAFPVDTGATDVDILTYRPDSQFLIVVGLPNEKEQAAGVSHFVWRSNRLHLVRFTPAARLCVPRP